MSACGRRLKRVEPLKPTGGPRLYCFCQNTSGSCTIICLTLFKHGMALRFIWHSKHPWVKEDHPTLK